MAKNTKKSTAQEAIKRFTAYTIRDFDRNGATEQDWTRIGVAFPHEDGKGFNVILQALPVDGKVVLRLHEPKEAAATE